ncbi:ferritin-like domain-containing protein [Gandjariella thermophila]|uniref:DUF4439 domain-containing protein n=1 Tax=Gandjariella thermophila TaxID=1931992 RepID=A0A4D4J9L2_9PSEU|nr:ferritin-like domain-containing protein [Gandjariella thermophila]GDY30533.1 hypothetical protein GTS_21660 [Gandjariella thermophila]
MPTTTTGGSRELPEETVDALQKALGTEHAAVWVYGLASAFLPAAAQPALTEGATAHRARRDATERLLRDAGATPAASAPAYLPPNPVTDAASAAAMLVSAENDTSVAWRGVLERSDDQDVRRAAVDALTASAVRAVSWRQRAGQSPAVVAFPGRP